VTERLTDLLHRAVDDLVIPPAPSTVVISHGRSVRRRRRFSLATGAALLAAGVGVAAIVGDAPADRGTDPADTTSGLTGAVFSVGVTVYWDGGAHHTTIDDQAIKSSYFTSVGLLVRHGDNNASDGGGPQRFSLVRPDGTVSPVSVVTEEIVPGVDPTEPYLAYTEVVDGVVQVVVHNVSTDEEVARVPLPGRLEWGGWSGPPVALDGDTVYVGTLDVIRTVDWRTGEMGKVDGLGSGYPSINGGRTVGRTGDRATVVDVDTGEVLLSVAAGRHGYLALSPDGRFATLDTGRSFDVYDIETGTHTTFEGGSYDYGWTAEDDLARLEHHHVVTCSPITAECTTGAERIPGDGGGVAPDDVRFAGQIFES